MGKTFVNNVLKNWWAFWLDREFLKKTKQFDIQKVVREKLKIHLLKIIKINKKREKKSEHKRLLDSFLAFTKTCFRRNWSRKITSSGYPFFIQLFQSNLKGKMFGYFRQTYR